MSRRKNSRRRSSNSSWTHARRSTSRRSARRLETLKKETEQALDIYTPDEVLSSGFDAAAKDRAAGLVASFRDYLASHQSEIDALQIIYSRPYNQRLTEPMLKELEKKLRDNHASWTEDRLWDAYAVTVPAKVKGRSQAGRFADLVSLVRFALEQQPVLAPFADSVAERFDEWLREKADTRNDVHGGASRVARANSRSHRDKSQHRGGGFRVFAVWPARRAGQSPSAIWRRLDQSA